MAKNQAALEAISDSFAELAQTAFESTYEINDTETTYSEFLEQLFENLDQALSEHVAREVLDYSEKEIESANGGVGLFSDDIQPQLDQDEDDEEVEDDYGGDVEE